LAVQNFLVVAMISRTQIFCSIDSLSIHKTPVNLHCRIKYIN
jgi:hypothetical protein